MERELEEKFDAIMGKPGVIGLVCADQRGFCLSARGVGSADQAGAIRNITNQARKLESNSTEPPIIRFESEQGYCLVRNRGDFVLGIFKSNSQ